jgi:hypothetical protein
VAGAAVKARKPDGTRWFTPTTVELMDRWLAEPQLLDWLRRTVELDGSVPEQQLALLAAALMPRILKKYAELQTKVLALQLRRRAREGRRH